MPPCISTALPPAVHHDTSGGRAAVVFVGAILHKLGKLTKPTTTTTTQEKINRSSATPLTPRATFVGVRNAAQQTSPKIASTFAATSTLPANTAPT
jgi:hypothetical protein